MDVRNLLNPEPNPQSAAKLVPPTESHSSESTTNLNAGDKRKRGAAWEAWEDRVLVKQVLADDPILNKAGKKEDRWREVSEHLKKVKIDHSWTSCKDRIDKLVTWYRQGEARSRQKTSAVEEVDKHVQNMTDIGLLFDLVSQNAQVRQEAKDKLAAKKIKGQKIREAAMRGQVRQRDLLEAEKNQKEDVLLQPSVQKAPKNQFAKEVDSVLEGFKEQATEFKKEVEFKKRRDQKAWEEQVLNENLRLLIESQKATNEMMQNCMNVFIQGAIRPHQN